MAMDFTDGRYKVYLGRTAGAPRIGRIDRDEFVRSDSNQLLYRLEGQDVYDMAGEYVGEIMDAGDFAMVVKRSSTCIDCILVFVPE